MCREESDRSECGHELTYVLVILIIIYTCVSVFSNENVSLPLFVFMSQKTLVFLVKCVARVAVIFQVCRGRKKHVNR